MRPTRLPATVECARSRLICGREGPRDTAGSQYAGTLLSMGYDDSFSVPKFKQHARLVIQKCTESHLVFDLIGVDVAIANALRRIMISEVASVAIETVQIWQNNGVIQDEVLAHRLGLIPFVVDPDMLEYRIENEELTEENSVCFSLHTKCTGKDVNAYKPSFSVTARDLHWTPRSEKERHKFAACPPRVVEPDILITKLRPGQEIELKVFLEKGIGKTHAKWSPVCTATYRLQPEFKFDEKRPIVGAEAEELKQLCPMGVFDIEEGGRICVKNPRNCTTCRACIERFPDQIELRKIKEHFIFSIESTGCIPASKIFKTAVNVLKEKATTLKYNLDSASSKASSA